MSRGVGMTNFPLEINKLKVVVFLFYFFLPYRKNLKIYKILLSLRSLYGQFTSKNMLIVGCMREYS